MSNASVDEAYQVAVSFAVRAALMHTDPAAFLGWMRQYGIRFFLDAMDMADTPSEQYGAMGTMLGLELWNNLPHPAFDYKPMKIREPGRNDPCLCGSGRKYKQCCAAAGRPMQPFSEENLLPVVLVCLSKKDLAALPQRRFSPDLLAFTAAQWTQAGDPARACLLLEPLFAAPTMPDVRHADAFDALMDAYLQLNKPRKRKALLQLCLSSADPVLRGVARQREAAMLLDAGDNAAAWRAFHAAQRESPDDPSLAALEMSMLQGEGRIDQMQQRARFWISQLSRRPDAGELADVIGLMRSIVEDPRAFGAQFMVESLPEVHAFVTLLAKQPPVKQAPKLDMLDDGLGVLQDPLGHELLMDWQAVADHNDLASMQSWLIRYPAAWDSPSVLEDLCDLLVNGYERLDWLEDHAIAPLCQRAGALRDAMLASAGKPLRQLVWGFHENRPLILLLMQRIAWLSRHGQLGIAIAEAEQLLAWNPDDNPGMRFLLSRLLAFSQRWSQLLDLCQRYPDEVSELNFQQALALFALDRKGEAVLALHAAGSALPKMLATLLANTVKPVKAEAYDIELGGEYESWLYRNDMRPIWEKCGALDWAKGVAAALKWRR